MPIREKLPRTFAAALACAILASTAAHANDGVTFRDALMPGGKARSSAQKLADGAACGTYGRAHTIPFMPAFEKCMNGRGWVLDHYTSNDVPAPGDRTTHYVDIRGDARGIGRGDAALQADTRACRASGENVDACLADRGWKVILTKYGRPLPPSRVVTSSPWTWSSSSSSSSSTERDDDQRRTDEFNRSMQQNSDTINQSIQSSNDAAAAAAVQDQVNQNLANMPMPPN